MPAAEGVKNDQEDEGDDVGVGEFAEATRAAPLSQAFEDNAVDEVEEHGSLVEDEEDGVRTYAEFLMAVL